MTNEAHQECGTGPEAGLVGVTLRALRVVGRLPGGLRNREKRRAGGTHLLFSRTEA